MIPEVTNYINNLYEYIKNIPYIYQLFFLSLFVIILIITLIVVSYIIIKILQVSIDNSNIFFYTYNKNTKNILNKYGNYKIKKVYIIKQPIREFIILLCDIVTFFNYSDILYNSKNYHTSLLFEINTENGNKFLLLEKNNSINLTDKFIINSNSNIKYVSMANKINKTFTLKTLLEETKEKIGNKNFYSWNISKNNCLEFTKNILQTLGKYNKKYEKYIYDNNLLQKYTPTDFIIHTFNTLSSILNIIEKCLYDNIFY
jgi:hypothetical protein